MSIHLDTLISLPRLDPLARALKLTFQGTHEELVVDIELGTT